MSIYFIRESRNPKTGKIPVTYSGRDTCPQSCPHYRTSCYAEGFYTRRAWEGVEKYGIEWAEFCEKIAALPDGQLWRHNIAGDLPGEGEKVDSKKLAALVLANLGKKGFTYSHKKSPAAIRAIRAANRGGFTVNLSADHIGEADQLADLKAGPVVSIVPIDAPEKLKTLAGRAVIVCPAQSREDITCKDCGLCANASRAVIVGFRAHGVRAKLADKTARKTIFLTVEKGN